MIRCMAPKLQAQKNEDERPSLLEFLAGLGSERCNEPAAFRDFLGRALCVACAEQAKKNHGEGATVLSILKPGSDYPLYPIQ